MPRAVTLVLVNRTGEQLGVLPPFELASPWWADAAGVLAGARAAHNAEVTVLRLMDAVGDPDDRYGMGGTVTYLAELNGPRPASLLPWSGVLDDDPRRATYARPGGPADDLNWATDALARLGRSLTGRAEQQRTWNLSSIWILPTAAGPAWLKVVPPFFGHEGRLLAALNADRSSPSRLQLPTVLATEGCRLLLADVVGEDQSDAPPEQLVAMVGDLVALQAGWAGRLSELLALGLPDWRPPRLGALIEAVVARDGAELDGSQRRALDGLLVNLGERFEALERCGLPASLVHGDFHPGNWRGTTGAMVLLDWGDAGVGHPLLDLAAFFEHMPADVVPPIRERWLAAWAAAVPGSDPYHAAELIAPISALRQAVMYRTILDGIERSEQRYHQADVGVWLGRAAALAGQPAAR